MQNPQTNPATGSLSHVAPWVAAAGIGAPATSSSAAAAPSTTFYNDSSDNLSMGPPLSPVLPAGARSRPQPSQTGAGGIDSPDLAYFSDERRPSIASVTTTASSQGSKASGQRGGIRKLQLFFGEEFPGRDSSDSSLTQAGPGKEHRSQSYSHSRPQRDRNHSNATDHTRDASPSSSRPRTPVPAPEVVPFLYQEADVSNASPTPSPPFVILLQQTHSFELQARMWLLLLSRVVTCHPPGYRALRRSSRTRLPQRT